jgi:hypothetical protein
MPLKIQSIKIEKTKYDRRIKLFDEEREEVKEKHEAGQSIKSLAREYKVDKNIIKIIVNPEFAESFRQKNIERQRQYREEKTYLPQRNGYMRNHRRYKQKLYKEGKIK